MTDNLEFKIACEDYEFEQIHKLNYEVYVEELGKEPPNPERRLVDRFHEENTYLICLDGHEVVGMMAIRAERPFSLDEKMQEVDAYLPPHNKACEFRVLAVRKDYRSRRLGDKLIRRAGEYGISKGYDLGVIAAVKKLETAYKRYGFVAFGSVVGTPEVPLQPMYISYDAFMGQ
jgi:ribosomal protein S18 acetylase RimI-like enzyme